MSSHLGACADRVRMCGADIDRRQRKRKGDRREEGRERGWEDDIGSDR